MSFPAKFEGGMCPADCGNRIHAGDMVRYDGDELVHDECAPKLSKYDLGPRETVCPDCWLVRPCGCVE